MKTRASRRKATLFILSAVVGLSAVQVSAQGRSSRGAVVDSQVNANARGVQTGSGRLNGPQVQGGLSTGSQSGRRAAPGMIDRARAAVSRMLPAKRAPVDPWLKGAKVVHPEMSINEVQLMKSADGSIPAMDEIYYVAAGPNRTIQLKSRKFTQLAKLTEPYGHYEQLVVIDGKIVLEDVWPSHGAGQGAKDHNPLVTPETFARYTAIANAKRDASRAILLNTFGQRELDNLGLDDLDIELMGYATNEFRLATGVEVHIVDFGRNRGSLTTNDSMGAWSLTVVRDGRVFLNDGWGDTVGQVDKDAYSK